MFCRGLYRQPLNRELLKFVLVEKVKDKFMGIEAFLSGGITIDLRFSLVYLVWSKYLVTFLCPHTVFL